MRTLTATGAVVRDVVWLTIVQPVRDGVPRRAGWPVGLAAIVASILAVYGLLTLTVVFAGTLRSTETLLITQTGTTIPAAGAWLCIAGVVLSLATLQTAALHLPWWVKLFALMTTTIALVYFGTAAASDPMLLLASALGLLTLMVLMVVRWRARFAWWEFVVTTLALGGAVFFPMVGSPTSRAMNNDWRALVAEGGLITIGSLAIPALLVAGAALAQIAVTASFSSVAAATREFPRRPLQLVGLLLVGWAVVELVRSVDDPENAAAGWLASGVALAGVVAIQIAVLAVARRPPAWSDLDEDSTPVNYLVAVASTALVLLQPVPAILREVARVLGPQWLFDASDTYLNVAASDLAQSVTRVAVGVIGLAIALPLARRGRPWAAMFMAAITVLSLFHLFRNRGLGSWAYNTVPQMAALLLLTMLVVAVVLLITRRLTLLRAVALASGILLCVLYPHRAILDDPISALLGFSGIGAVLFGLVWRLLTEGDITREGTPRWPVPSRVLLYCASALIGVTSTAFMALTRSSGGVLDATIFADSGDFMLGTPLFLTAAVGCLAIALAPARHG